MKKIKMGLTVMFLSIVSIVYAQELSPEITKAIKMDDSLAITKLVTKETVNNCYRNYSLLSLTIRENALKSYKALIVMGADINKLCNGYNALLHAARFGRLEIVKLLVAKGADIKYKYDGNFDPAKGKNAIWFAEAEGKTDVAEYLKTLK